MIGNNKKGFTLFFALLVASLALAIGASIFDLTLRELTLSEAATQSQYALYAADGGSECALYWDNKYANVATNNNGGSNSAFATSSVDTGYAQSGIVCSGVDIAAAGVTARLWPVLSAPDGPPNTNAATTTFSIGGGSSAPCATVYVYKSGNPTITSIVAHGYNTCIAGPLQLERVLQITY